jgi:hypothetical protein
MRAVGDAAETLKAVANHRAGGVEAALGEAGDRHCTEAGDPRRVGINLDEQSMDWGTVVQRRTSKEPLDKGGWSLFPYGAPAAEYRDPVFATNLRGNGKDAKAFPVSNWVAALG